MKKFILTNVLCAMALSSGIALAEQNEPPATKEEKENARKAYANLTFLVNNLKEWHKYLNSFNVPENQKKVKEEIDKVIKGSEDFVKNTEGSMTILDQIDDPRPTAAGASSASAAESSAPPVTEQPTDSTSAFRSEDTSTPTETKTDTKTNTPTDTNTNTPTDSKTKTDTNTNTPTDSKTKTDTNTNTTTDSKTKTDTNTNTTTNTA